MSLSLTEAVGGQGEEKRLVIFFQVTLCLDGVASSSRSHLRGRTHAVALHLPSPNHKVTLTAHLARSAQSPSKLHWCLQGLATPEDPLCPVLTGAPPSLPRVWNVLRLPPACCGVHPCSHLTSHISYSAACLSPSEVDLCPRDPTAGWSLHIAAVVTLSRTSGQGAHYGPVVPPFFPVLSAHSTTEIYAHLDLWGRGC